MNTKRDDKTARPGQERPGAATPPVGSEPKPADATGSVGHYGPGYGDPTPASATDDAQGTPRADAPKRPVPHPLEPASAGGAKPTSSPDVAKD